MNGYPVRGKSTPEESAVYLTSRMGTYLSGNTNPTAAIYNEILTLYPNLPLNESSRPLYAATTPNGRRNDNVMGGPSFMRKESLTKPVMSDYGDMEPTTRMKRVPETTLITSASKYQRVCEKKSKAPAIRAEDRVTHMHTAFACDFFVDGVGPEEEDMLPDGTDYEIYAHVRNVLLNHWRSDVTMYLTEQKALELFTDCKMKPYVLAAWRFLDGTSLPVHLLLVDAVCVVNMSYFSAISPPKFFKG